jgi:histidinol-phosphate aminotransferase
MKLKKSVKDLKKYQPPLSGRRGFSGLRLDFNERTIPPGPHLSAAIEQLGKIDVGVYPEYDGQLEKQIARYLSVNADQVCIFNGSDLALADISRAFLSAGDNVLLPSPSFPIFDLYAALSEVNISRVSYSGDELAFPEEDFYAGLRKGADLAVICNPNNPTGGSVRAELIEAWAGEFPGTVFLVDEAYAEFSKISLAGKTAKLENIIVTRTFSKALGLAAARIGYTVASPELTGVLKKVTSPYQVNMYAYELAKAALADMDYVSAYVDGVMNRAKPMVEKFFKDSGIKFYPSAANFILFEPAEPARLERQLRAKGFLIRPQDKPGIEGTIRMTIGTYDQMKQFINAFKESN